MENLRKYGKPPFNIAVIHGGPGAPGEMAPVARELSHRFSILEPMQTKSSLEGQIEELKDVLEKNANLPIVLIGYSWGAFLSFIVAAKYPNIVKKLILVDSGPFEASYAEQIMPTRLKHLNEQERVEIGSILEKLENSDQNNRQLFTRFGELTAKADHYQALPATSEILDCDSNIFQNVWNEAEKMRANGKLLSFAKYIRCPVIAIHGDYDPHPAAGVRDPLSKTLANFKFYLLEKCGHTPWLEKYAKDKFYSFLRQELNN